MKTPSETQRSLYGLIAVILLLNLPFVRKPFHIDDYLYIDIAKNVFRKPWSPQDMPYIFEGKSSHGDWTHDMASHSHPPFTSYFIAGWMALLGQRARFSEVGLHLGFLIFPLMLGTSTLFLARRFTADPVLAAVWIMVTPLVTTMSHGLSPDIITVSLWVTSITAFIYALDTERKGLLGLSAAAAGLAVFTSYQALSIVGLFLLYAALHRKLDRRAGLVSLVPVLVVVGWLLLGYWHFGRFLLTNTIRWGAESQGWTAERFLMKTLCVLIDLGSVTAFPVFVLAILSGWIEGRVVMLVGLISLGIVALAAPQYPWWEKAMLVVFLTTGLSWLIRILARGGRHLALLRQPMPDTGQTLAASRDEIFLILWVLGVFTYCIILFFTFAPRYILPMVPPAMLLLVNEARARYARSRRFLAIGAAATLTLAVVLSAADYQFAHIYPKIAHHLQSTYGKSGQKLWYAGEWGFRYYCEAIGAEIVDTDKSALKGGDLVATAELASGYATAQDVETMSIPVEHRRYTPSLPVRLLDRFAHAGFYGLYHGLLPFSFSRRPLEEVTVKQVSLLVDGLPEARITGEEPKATVAYPTIWTLGGQSKLTLQQAPNSSVTYRLKIPADAKLAFSIGVRGRPLAPDSLLTFGLSVKGSASEEQWVFTRALATSGDGTAPWVPETVPLAAYAGQSVDLTLRLTGDTSTIDGRSARGGWGDFVLIPRSTARP